MNNIYIIAAMTKERVIGNGLNIPWHIREDFQEFKRLTTGDGDNQNNIIFGSVTGKTMLERGALKGRVNIMIDGPETPGVVGVRTLDEALAVPCKGKIWICGGASVYAQTIGLADNMVISYVKGIYAGDKFFPEFDKDSWLAHHLKSFADFDQVWYRRK